uniref:hypothetical protein n=1 Tax=Methylobacterium oryzae TaxID=334852 RepID=UPI00155D8A51|nr:hypothetical protein [Methylobacterium oryzae]
MTICQTRLAASLLAATHIADRHLIASFVADPATQPAPNPFAQTSVGAVRQVWRQRTVEFDSFEVQVAGLSCLLRALIDMSVDEVLVQEILRAGLHTVNVFYRSEGVRIIGAVLYGKPGIALPVLPAVKSAQPVSGRRKRGVPDQLDLFG